MRKQAMRWAATAAVLAAVLALGVGVGRADEGCGACPMKSECDSPQAQGQVRVEVRAEADADRPQVRMFINGKEVEAGGDVSLGDGNATVRIQSLRIRTAEDAAGPPQGKALLGVMVAPLDDETAKAAGVDGGAVVMEVVDGSAAAKAGIRAGDVIIRIGDKPVTSPEQLAEFVGRHEPGAKLPVLWSRQGKRMDAAVTLGGAEAPARPERPQRPEFKRPERPDRPDRRPELPETAPAEGAAFLGVMAAPLDEDMKQIAGTDRGVLVNSLSDDAPAAKAGLQPGDVIVRVGETDVDSPEALVAAVRARKPGDRVAVAYVRMGKKRTAQVTLAAAPPEAMRREGVPLSDLPDALMREIPQLREYLEQLRPNIEKWQRDLGTRPPAVRPPVAPGEKTPPAQPYDVGKDMGRIMERLDRIERRLDEMERRLGEPRR